MPFKIKNGFPSQPHIPHLPEGLGRLCPLQARMGWTPSPKTALACLPVWRQGPVLSPSGASCPSAASS